MSLESMRDDTLLLSRMSADGLEFLESVASEVEFTSGAVIFEADDTADRFYLVAAGKVGLEIDIPGRAPSVLETLGPGELVGISWLFPPPRWNWRARALEDTKTIAFDAAAVRDRCEQDRDLALHVYKTVAAEAVRRLQATRVRLLDLYPGAGQ